MSGPLARVTLVLGGARSGKSRFAEGLVEASGLTPVYLATAQAFDAEMRERIALHRSRRGEQWLCVEEPIELAATLQQACAPDRCVLVDCLTLWTTNAMLAERDVMAETEALATLLPSLRGPVVFVSNEVGLGIVPDNALARRFRDLAGVVNQRIAAAAQTVHFVAAGLPMTLKQEIFQ